MSYADLLANRHGLRLPETKQDECVDAIMRNGRTLLNQIDGLTSTAGRTSS